MRSLTAYCSPVQLHVQALSEVGTVRAGQFACPAILVTLAICWMSCAINSVTCHCPLISAGAYLSLLRALALLSSQAMWNRWCGSG